MRVWEFRDEYNYRWLITEKEDKSLELEVVTFSSLHPDWEIIDKMQEEGKLKYQKEYEVR